MQLLVRIASSGVTWHGGMCPMLWVYACVCALIEDDTQLTAAAIQLSSKSKLISKYFILVFCAKSFHFVACGMRHAAGGGGSEVAQT